MVNKIGNRTGMHSNHLKGPANGAWAGGTTINSGGYRGVLQRDHPRAGANGYVREHILVVERAMGKPLPPKAVVHHVDGNRQNNANRNLVVCPDDAYHALLHTRARALAACGNANWRRCNLCGQHDDPANLYHFPNCRVSQHRACAAAYQRARTSRRANLDTI